MGKQVSELHGPSCSSSARLWLTPTHTARVHTHPHGTEVMAHTWFMNFMDQGGPWNKRQRHWVRRSKEKGSRLAGNSGRHRRVSGRGPGMGSVRGVSKTRSMLGRGSTPLQSLVPACRPGFVSLRGPLLLEGPLCPKLTWQHNPTHHSPPPSRPPQDLLGRAVAWRVALGPGREVSPRPARGRGTHCLFSCAHGGLSAGTASAALTAVPT